MDVIHRRYRRILVACLTVAALVLASAASAAAATTYYVSPDGSDSSSGSSSEPFRTIGSATRLARRGDVVLVRSGTYSEQVSLAAANSGATLRGIGPTRPVIDGGGTRGYGFYNLDGDDVTIQNFEITRQTDAGIYTRGKRDLIADTLVHHIGSQDVNAATGIRVVWGGQDRVVRNTVHSIGPGGESIGIWLVQTRDANVDGNTVYLARKEGVRDWMGLDNTIQNNRLFLNWTGLTFNVSTGAVATNNYIYENVEGFTAKHTSYRWVLDYWKLTAPHWSKFVHNTVHRSSEASVWLAQSDQPLDYLEVRNNILSDAGLAYIRDAPSIRGPHVVVDGNAYADPGASGRPSFFYKAGWNSSPGIGDWSSYRSSLGWEATGMVLDPRFVDPATGDFDLRPSSEANRGSLQLDDPLANQLGARGLPSAPAHWTPYPMTPVDSSSTGTWWTNTQLKKTADANQATYWLSSTAGNEYVTYDFGQSRTFDHVVVTLYQHNDVRSAHGYRFEVSDDRVHWRTAREGQNPDTEGSSYKYELPGRTTARYLRYTMIDTSCNSYAPRTGCGAYFVLADVEAGLLTAAGAPDPPAEPTNLPPPAATPPPANPAPTATSTPPPAPAAPATSPPPATPPTPPTTVAWPPLTSPPAPAKLVLLPARPTVKAGSVRVGLRCVGQSPACRGTVTVRVRPRRSRGASRAAAPVVARRSVVINPGRASTVRIRLKRQALKILRRRGVHRFDVVVRGSRGRPLRSTISVRTRR
jgi:F5/8 type C domain-containing protein/copper-binding protein NosD/uncharacterized protein DUF1565